MPSFPSSPRYKHSINAIMNMLLLLHKMEMEKYVKDIGWWTSWLFFMSHTVGKYEFFPFVIEFKLTFNEDV